MDIERTIYKTLIILTILTVPAIARAQTQHDEVFVGVRSIGSTKLDNRRGETEQRSIFAIINPHPIQLGNSGTMLSLGASGGRTLFDLDGGAAYPGEPAQRQLVSADVRIGLVHRVSNRWIITEGVVPGIRSDLEQAFSKDDVQIGGFLMASYLISTWPRVSFQFGVVGQTHATIVPILPVIGLNVASDHFLLELGVTGLNAIARLGTRVELGLFTSFDSSWYRMQPAASGLTAAASNLWLMNVITGPQLNVRPFGDIWINARAGYTVKQIARLGDADRNEIKDLDFMPKGAVAFQLAVSYGPRPSAVPHPPRTPPESAAPTPRMPTPPMPLDRP